MATTQSPPLTSGTDRLTGRAWALLLVLCGAIFLEGIDVSMLGVALPSIQAELGMSTDSLQWVVSAYVLGYGGFMLLGGRMADLLGRRRMFLIWLGVFLVFSGLGGFATEGWILIIARFVTGVAAAFMTPAGLSIITTSFPEGPQRNRALLVYAGTAAAGFSLGLVVGGLLTAISWRWVFFAPVILTIAILLAAFPLIPAEERSPGASRKDFDLAGATTVTGGMLLLVLAVSEAHNLGWPLATGLLAAGLALLGAFVRIQRRAAAPLLRLGILRSPTLLRANLSAILFAGSFFGFQFIAVLYFQQLRDWTPLETGLALLVLGIDAVLAPTLTPWLVNRFGNVRVIFGGLVLAALAYVLFLPIGPGWTYAAMFPTLILIGLSFALAYGPLTIAATDGVAEEEQGLAGGLLYTSWQFGGALGLAAVSAVNATFGAGGGSPQALLDGYHAALIVPVAATALAALITAFGLRTRAVRT
ncbi:MFS transporter [Streptosporangium sp. KLBMP 9127]|nr:MFS transporter [Streptosporangium sp. KLBMP 9127]